MSQERDYADIRNDGPARDSGAVIEDFVKRWIKVQEVQYQEMDCDMPGLNDGMPST